VEDAVIVLGVIALWPWVLGWWGWPARVLLLVDLAAMAFILVRRWRRLMGRGSAGAALAAVILYGFGAPSEASAGTGLKDLIAQADRAIVRGRYVEATDLVTAALEEHPGDIPLLLRLGTARSLSRDFRGAERALTTAIAYEPDNPKVIHNIGLLRLRQGREEEAQDALASVLEIAPWFPEAHYHLGVIAERRGEQEKALEYYIAELNVNPSSAKAWQRVALIRDQGRHKGLSWPQVTSICVACLAVAGGVIGLRVRQERLYNAQS
jgi:Flp pilus assembly protein TadD